MQMHVLCHRVTSTNQTETIFLFFLQECLQKDVNFAYLTYFLPPLYFYLHFFCLYIFFYQRTMCMNN